MSGLPPLVSGGWLFNVLSEIKEGPAEVIVDPAVAKADADTWLMAFTTAAGAGFMPNPAFEGVVLPVTETRTMTSTASTTRAVAKIAAVMAVLRFGASL